MLIHLSQDWQTSAPCCRVSRSGQFDCEHVYARRPCRCPSRQSISVWSRLGSFTSETIYCNHNENCRTTMFGAAASANPLFFTISIGNAELLYLDWNYVFSSKPNRLPQECPVSPRYLPFADACPPVCCWTGKGYYRPQPVIPAKISRPEGRREETDM